ncbi:hypothetical protein Tco_0828446 [Tanacetum coccineum]
MSVLTKRIDDLTKGKSEKGKNEKGKSEKGLIAESFDWDEEIISSDDKGTTKIRAFMEIAEDEPFVGKTDARSGQWLDITMKKITSNSECECETQEHLPPLLKLIRAAPIVSPAYVIKKKTENKSPGVLESCSDKKADSSTEQLLLTLMKKVKGLKKKIEIPSGTYPSNS